MNVDAVLDWQNAQDGRLYNIAQSFQINLYPFIRTQIKKNMHKLLMTDLRICLMPRF